ncbi:ribonuclease H-like domain-containing protein, partial [Tanacetum coccineum]
MDGINIDDLTIEQYLRLTQENQTPSMDMDLDEKGGYTTDKESAMSEHEAIDPVHAVNTRSFEEELSLEEDLDEWLNAKIEKHMSKQEEKKKKIEMDDMTQQETLGTMKNVLAKINKFEFPCDFVVTEMPENLGKMIILGRPFLETIHAQIDVFQEEILLGIGEDRIKFDINGNPRQSNITIEKIYMANSSQEEESFNPLEIGQDLFSYESPACLQFEQDIRNYDNNDPHNEIVGQTNPLLDKGGLTKRLHVCKPVQVFYDDRSDEDCGMWPTCDPDSSFRYGYKEVFKKSEQGMLRQWVCFCDHERRTVKGSCMGFADFLQVHYENKRIDDTTRERRYYEWVAQNYEFDNNRTPSITIMSDKFSYKTNYPMPISPGEWDTSVHSLGRDEGSLSLNELTNLYTSLSKKVESLESELKQTKQTSNVALTKLIKRVKKLEQTIKTSQARRRAKVVISNDEEVEEDPSNQGRSLIEELDLDAEISLVPSHATDIDDTQISDQPEEQLGVFSAATVLADAARRRKSVENVQTYIRRRREVSTGSGGVRTASRLVSTADISTAGELDSNASVKAKDKGKAIMHESESLKKIKKRVQEARLKGEQEQERTDFETVLELQKQLDEREEVAVKVNQAHDIDWSDHAVLRYHTLQNRPFSVAEVRNNMCLYLKNKGGYKMSHFKGISYEDIRPIFERVWDHNQAFILMGSEIEKEQDDVIAEQAVKESSRTAGGRRKKSLARKRARETLSEERAKKQKLEDDAEKEELQVLLNIVPEEESLDVESLATKYP